MRKGSEAQVVALIQKICSKYRKFWVEFEDFDSFEHDGTCTIYFKVKHCQPFLDLVHDLKEAKYELKRLGCRISDWANVPHVSLVRRLPYINYETAMPNYKNSIFRDSFVASGIVLSRNWKMDDGFRPVKIPFSWR